MSSNSGSGSSSTKAVAIIIAVIILASALGLPVAGYVGAMALVSFLAGALFLIVGASEASTRAFGAFVILLLAAMLLPMVTHILHSGFGLLLLVIILAVAFIAGYARFKDARHRVEHWVEGEKGTSTKKRLDPRQ